MSGQLDSLCNLHRKITVPVTSRNKHQILKCLITTRRIAIKKIKMYIINVPTNEYIVLDRLYSKSNCSCGSSAGVALELPTSIWNGSAHHRTVFYGPVCVFLEDVCLRIVCRGENYVVASVQDWPCNPLDRGRPVGDQRGSSCMDTIGTRRVPCIGCIQDQQIIYFFFAFPLPFPPCLFSNCV